MKRYFLILLVISVVVVTYEASDKVRSVQNSSITMQIGNPYAIVNGEQKTIDSESSANIVPIVQNSRAMLPIRFIGEMYGFDVSWHDFFRRATLEKEDLIIELTVIGNEQDYTARVWTSEYERELIEEQNILHVSGDAKFFKKITLDSPPMIIEDRIFLPIRFVSEEMGLIVKWNEFTQEITITPQ